MKIIDELAELKARHEKTTGSYPTKLYLGRMQLQELSAWAKHAMNYNMDDLEKHRPAIYEMDLYVVNADDYMGCSHG